VGVLEGIDSPADLRALGAEPLLFPTIAIVPSEVGGPLDQAIAQRASGVNLPASDAFRALLPENGFADCSALLYRNVESLMSAVPADLLEQFELAGAVSDGLSTGVVCVFGGDDRITASATGGSLLGIGSLLGMASAIQDGGPGTQAKIATITENEVIDHAKPVSSRG